jgi:lipoate-protein ligase A
MRSVWRVVDTGLLPAARNIALNRAMLESRQANETPNTLRFLCFEPSALLGFHQNAEQELNLDFCRGHGIAIQRRITGGGAIYFDPAHLGWELYLGRGDLGVHDMPGVAARICEAATEGLRSLGVDARFRPRNDIEVMGRKLSGTGGVFDGNALLYQGTLLLDCDVQRMLRVLRVPAEKLGDKAIASLRERVVGLAELLGRQPDPAGVKQVLTEAFSRAFGVTFRQGALDTSELGRLESALHKIDRPEWVYRTDSPTSHGTMLEATRKLPAGMIRAVVAYDAPAGRIRQACFTGDFFVSPARTVVDLEAALKDIALEKLNETVAAFFGSREADMLGLRPGDFSDLVRQACRGSGADAD